MVVKVLIIIVNLLIITVNVLIIIVNVLIMTVKAYVIEHYEMSFAKINSNSMGLCYSYKVDTCSVVKKFFAFYENKKFNLNALTSSFLKPIFNVQNKFYAL
jgi:hypothetical protein